MVPIPSGMMARNVQQAPSLLPMLQRASTPAVVVGGASLGSRQELHGSTARKHAAFISWMADRLASNAF